jgi:AraC-like DNA-binding protein/quercetin dioxygenase-like cupin family protein
LDALETSAVKVGEGVYPAGLCIPRHSHDTSQLIYVVTGLHWSGLSAGGGDCPPGTVRFLPAGEPHENYFPTESRCIEIVLRPPILELAREHAGALPETGELPAGSAIALGARLERELRRQDDAAALEIEAITLRLLVTSTKDGMCRERAIQPWLLRVREMLHAHGMERLTLTDLARCAGRHPVQISREFHRYFGCTIGSYVRQVRIARAQRLLSREEMSVAEIALACGFSDQSHFTTQFHRLTGLPPKKFRDSRFERDVGHLNSRSVPAKNSI